MNQFQITLQPKKAPLINKVYKRKVTRKKGSMSKGCLCAKIHNSFEMHENNLSVF